MGIVNKLITNLSEYSMILRGIRLEIWINPRRSPALHKVWVEAGLIPNKVMGLTPEGIEIVKLCHLLQYEFKIASDQINNDVLETNPDNYTLLRAGLGEYFGLYIRDMFLNNFDKHYGKVKCKTGPFKMLDVGCGNGAYSTAMDYQFTHIDFTLIDRSEDHLKLLPFAGRHLDNIAI